MQVLKEAIRKRILEVAEDLFYQAGFEKTTTRQIAANVGVSLSNLYLYYDNKEAIFGAVIEPFYVNLNLKIEEILGSKNTKEDIYNKLSTLVRHYIVKDRRKFIILIDRSSGTKYECSKTMVIQGLKNHFYSLLPNSIHDKELMAYILSNNLISGMIEIAKNFKDENQLEESMKHLITYHIEGLKALLY